MKVSGSSQGSVVGPGARRPGAAAAGFSLGGGAAAEGTRGAGAASGAAAVSGLDALLMLQEPEDATARRRRQVRRADGLLDRLEALKLAVLGEGDPQAALQRLAAAVRERRGAVDEPGLAQVLDAVETRAAVELAKQDVRAAA